MTRLLALAATLVFLLAGCSSPPSGGPDAVASSSTTTSTGPSVPDVSPLPSPETAVCEVVRSNAGTPAGLGIYADRGLSSQTGCVFADLFDDLAWAGSALVEVEWTPQASMTAADAWFESDNCVASPTEPCTLPKERDASSPLALALEGDDFLGNIAENLEVQVAAQGVVAQQSFTVHLTLFANATVDPGFTAIP